MNILVTGGSGFIGTPLVKELKKQGYTVLVLSRMSHEDSSKSVAWLNSDLSNPLSYQSAIRSFSPEVLIHLAWQDIPNFSFEKSKKNLTQSLDLIHFTIGQKSLKKILVSGSCFEANQLHGKCKEINTGSPNDDFTWAKHSLFLWLEMICKRKDVQLAWMRVFYVYGPYQRPDSLIPTILTRLQEHKLPDLRTPYNANDFIYVDDVVNAFLKALTIEHQSGIFNLGSGRSTPVIEICRIAEQIVLGQDTLTKQLEAKTKSSGCNINFWADIGHAKSHLKWSPSTTLVDGIYKTQNWLKCR